MTKYLKIMLFRTYSAVLVNILTCFSVENVRIKFLLMTSYFDHDVIAMTNFDRK